MTYAIACPDCGVDFVQGEGPQLCRCGNLCQAYECGAPPRQEGFPNIIGDELRKHFDWGAGCEITSKSQRRKVYEKKGLNLTPVSEIRRQHGGMEKFRTVNYSGMASRKSSAEKRQIL